MDIRKELQRNAVADEVQALIAVVVSILKGVLFATKAEALQDGGAAQFRR